MGKLLSVANDFPRLADKYMERTTFESQKTDKPTGDRPDNLYAPVARDGGERGSNWTGRTKSTSLYTKVMLHPEIPAVAAAVGVGAIVAALVGRRAALAPPSSPRQAVSESDAQKPTPEQLAMP
ncbi:MAG: hypothetical protein ACJ79A_01130 [Gemmatimonadaceae bacterium]